MRVPFILLTLIAFNHFGILTTKQIEQASWWQEVLGVLVIWFAAMADTNDAFPPRRK